MALLSEIQSACSHELLASRDYAAIASAVSAGRVSVQQKFGGIGLVLETLGPEGGADLLDALYLQSASVPALKWAWVLINRSALDFGAPATRAMISKLIPSPAKEALLAVAEVPDHVTAHQCEVAMKNDDGTEK